MTQKSYSHFFVQSILRVISMFLLFIISSTTFAQVVFEAGIDVGSQTDAGSGSDVLSKDEITLSVTQGAFGAAQYRIAKGHTLTISSTSGEITTVVFICTANDNSKYGPGCFSYQDGYSYSGKVGTWNGSASSISFTAETYQVRIYKIEVYLNNEDPINHEIDWTSSADSPLSVSEVLERGAQLYPNEDSGDDVFVKGIVSQVDTIETINSVAKYYISDDGSTSNQLYIYRGAFLQGYYFEDGNNLEVNDAVTVVGKVTKYSAANQIKLELCDSRIYSLNGMRVLSTKIDGIY